MATTHLSHVPGRTFGPAYDPDTAWRWLMAFGLAAVILLLPPEALAVARDETVFGDIDKVLETAVKNIRKWGILIIIGSFAVYGIAWGITGRPKHWMLLGAAVGAIILGLAKPLANYFVGSEA